MRTIVKQGTGGYSLTQAHQSPPQTSQRATSRWNGFRDKLGVLESLLNEQYWLCCYSELRADEEELGYHIEHVENKRQNPARTFDYANLAASALKSNALKAGQTAFGGHASGKMKSVDSARFISPHQTDCRRFFAYLSDGRIVHAVGLTRPEQERAKYTINTLNLNNPFLVTRRRQWWDELSDLYEQHIADDQSLYHLACIDLVPTQVRLSRFFSLTRQFFGPSGHQALANQTPALL